MARVPILAAATAAFVLSAALDGAAQPIGYVSPNVVLQDGILRIEVDEARPLFRALRQLQRRYGCVATYEEPPFESPADIEEKAVATTGYRYVLPRGGAFTFSHPFGAAGDPEAFEHAVRALVRDYEDRGFPGRFRVEREGTTLHVIPAEMRDETGAIVSVRPIMDATIIFAPRAWADVYGVEAVVQAVGAVSGASIALGPGWPLNVMNASASVLVPTTNRRGRSLAVC